MKRLITQDEARKVNLVEDRKTDQVIGTGLSEIRGIVQDISAGIPIGHVAEDSSEEQLNELKRCLPSEIARVSTTIAKLEKEL